MKVGIIQPNYMPWRGYFDFIRQVDHFVFLDDVQYTKRDWRNRNKVRLLSGETVWLSVPVRASRDTLIMDTAINYEEAWVRKHLNVIEHNYSKSPYFETYFHDFKAILDAGHKTISDLDSALTRQICAWLGITTTLSCASDLGSSGSKDEKLIEVAQKVGGTRYLSGPAARAYIQPGLWDAAGIALEYIAYPDYPAYPQMADGFDPAVSVMDLLFMTGPAAPEYIWGHGAEQQRDST